MKSLRWADRHNSHFRTRRKTFPVAKRTSAHPLDQAGTLVGSGAEVATKPYSVQLFYNRVSGAPQAKNLPPLPFPTLDRKRAVPTSCTKQQQSSARVGVCN